MITEPNSTSGRPNFVANFEKGQLESFLGAHWGILCWCPGANCGWIAMKAREGLFEDQSNDFLCQNCQTDFCFYCGRKPRPVGGILCQPEVIIVEDKELVEQQGEAQPPLDKYNKRLWPNRNPKDHKDKMPLCKWNSNENNLVNVKAIKQCPRCTIDTENIGGCNGMTCRSC
jgi:hypothetical protein